MKISVLIEFDKENDGVDGSVCHTRENIEDLYELAQFMTDAVRGAGFSYVVNTGFEKEDGDVLFGVM